MNGFIITFWEETIMLPSVVGYEKGRRGSAPSLASIQNALKSHPDAAAVDERVAILLSSSE